MIKKFIIWSIELLVGIAVIYLSIKSSLKFTGLTFYGYILGMVLNYFIWKWLKKFHN